MLPVADLDHVLEGVGALWERLRGKRLFVTGGTGVIGKWLLYTLAEADRRAGLGVQVVALSRDPARFVAEHAGLLTSARLEVIAGDVRAFELPDVRFDYVVHAATDVLAQAKPLDVFDTCTQGTRRVLELALASGAGRLLLLSSGAVYGPQPLDLEGVPESFGGAPDPTNPLSAYGEGKRVAEWLASTYAAEHALGVAIARIFTVAGPFVPLDRHFAIGNFIGDALAGRAIRMTGGGQVYRSYLHLADLAVWLWTMLLRDDASGAYNLGSSDAVSIAELAARVDAAIGGAGVAAGSAGGASNRYVPDVSRAGRELGLHQQIGLDDAIRRTADWHRQRAA